ncbi:hypothetical protein PVL29_006772 [Vitis rotundifolia]|uniref:Uncharacterized protein n=1 Tax=Vitis rotundifolia TaxID=103349 RepID=A0AA39A805_VITRO|nr:hypothetical protein PVL29_006772 [Vitis rotundifolia]
MKPYVRGTGGFEAELIDIAYDVEDVVDLILRSAVQGRRSGILNRLTLFISDFIYRYQLHKRIKWIDSKILSLSHDSPRSFCFFSVRIEEIDWSTWRSVQDQNVAKTVVYPVIEKVSVLLAKESLHPQLKRKVREIQDKFRFMNGFLKELESVELADGGMVWMEELCDISRSAVDVIGLFINRREQLRRSWRSPFRKLAVDYLKSRHKFSMEMEQIHCKILDISIRRPENVPVHGHETHNREPASTFGILQQPAQEPNIISFDDDDSQAVMSRPEEPDIISFYDDVDAVMARLLADDSCFCMISIVGMEGAGKTTLAKLIYENDVVVDHFPYRAWASATNMFKILDDIVKQFIDYKKSTKTSWWEEQEEMKQKLKAFLMDKRYLIVLDHAWISNVYILNELLSTLPEALNGSRMIVTTCEMSLPSHLQTRSIHHALRLRSDDESWALFTHTLKRNIPQELQTMKREIAKRCGGLPLAIVKLGAVLSQKDANIEEWSIALEQLHRDQKLWSNTLSMIDRKCPLHMKRCLFYFGLFPQNIDVPARRLIALWNETSEDVAEMCLIKLIAQGMVQVTKKKLNGDVKICRLPDALQRHWLSKAQQTTFLQFHTNTRSELSLSTGLVRRLVDHLDKEDFSYGHIHGEYNRTLTSLKPHYRHTLSFLSFDTQEGSKPGEDIGNFLHRCISSSCFLLLLVLDLEHVFRPKLPETIGKLSRLRYLGLRWTFLEMLPSSISKLQNLQTLDLKHAYINILPNSIWKIQYFKFMPQPRVGSLTNLQTLWGLFVDEETPVKDGLDGLVNLKKLGLTCRLMPSQQQAMLAQLEAVANWVLKLNHLHTLRLKSDDGENQPGDLDLKPLSGLEKLSSIYLLGRLKNPLVVFESPGNLSDLTLSGSGLMEDPLQKLDKLPNLKILRLLAKSYTGKNMLCPSGGFPQLRVLKLWKLEELEEWNVEEGALRALRDLEI